MRLRFLLLFNFLAFSQTLGKLVEVQCPSHCKCDIFEKLKRATCTNRTLAVIESNLPEQTQILDLSFNQISHLNRFVFRDQNLVSLKLLNISHNKVSHIHFQTFDGLTQLKTLDLSYNAVQYLRSWFRSLTSLEELYLRGNSFSRFKDGAVFASKSLKRLDLSLCRISYIGEEALTQLPNLEILDLSENYLIQLSVDVIMPATALNTLRVANNSFSCNGVMATLSAYCAEKGISFTNPCPKRHKSNKFERIVNMAQPEDEKNSWIYDDEEIANATIITTKCNNTRLDKSLLQEIVDLSPALSILISFIYGIAVGLVIGCTVQIRGKKKKADTDNTYVSFDDPHLRRRSYRTSYSSRSTRAGTTDERESLPLREWTLSESTPVLFRKGQASA